MKKYLLDGIGRLSILGLIFLAGCGPSRYEIERDTSKLTSHIIQYYGEKINEWDSIGTIQFQGYDFGTVIFRDRLSNKMMWVKYSQVITNE